MFFTLERKRITTHWWLWNLALFLIFINVLDLIEFLKLKGLVIMEICLAFVSSKMSECACTTMRVSFVVI